MRPHHVHTAAVAVVEARSVTGVQRLLTTHLGAALAARVVVMSAVASSAEEEDRPRGVSPQAMLAAAERVGGEPHRCVVVAHDATGVDAARRAGMRVVCVPSQVRFAAAVLTPRRSLSLRRAPGLKLRELAEARGCDRSMGPAVCM